MFERLHYCSKRVGERLILALHLAQRAAATTGAHEALQAAACGRTLASASVAVAAVPSAVPRAAQVKLCARGIVREARQPVLLGHSRRTSDHAPCRLLSGQVLLYV